MAVLAAGLTLGVAGGTAQLPGGQVSLPVCANGVDDDGDGKVDLGDPGCVASAGATEVGGPTIPSIEETVGGATGTTPPPSPGGGGSGGGGGGGGGGSNTTVTATPSGKSSTGTGAAPGSGNSKTGGVGPGGNKKDGDGQPKPPPPYKADGTPTIANPSATIAPFGPAPIGVPNIVIDQFEIPPFLLPIYQACGTEYDIPWQVLASINKIETAFGTNLNVSSAGAMGWMQFIPSTWAAYGTDANGDGKRDPYNPVDAICSAARYLRAAGGNEDLPTAIFAYNHADWYVDEVLLYARSYGRIPQDLLGSLTGLTEGAHFPIAANARYADDIEARDAMRRSEKARKELGNAADVISSSPTRRGINIFARKGAPVVAVNDGVIKDIGHSKRLGNYIVLRDAYGNNFTYASLGSIVSHHPVPKPEKLTAADFRLVSPPDDAAPSGPATLSRKRSKSGASAKSVKAASAGPEADGKSSKPGTSAEDFAGLLTSDEVQAKLAQLPDQVQAKRARAQGGDLDEELNGIAVERVPGFSTFRNYFKDVLGLSRKDAELRPLREGSKVIGGTVLGRVGASGVGAPHINFAIRPAGRGAPRIDPKPVLDGWKLLEATAIYRAAGKNPFAVNLGVGGVLLMSKEALIRRVLADPRIETYACGRTDIGTGQIDRRVLATLEFLVEKGFRLTVTSLKCGHGFLTASGNVSNHSSGNAVDIAAINGIPVLGNQGPGTLTDSLLKSVLQLQGTMVPEELISLEDLGGPSFPLGDHDDHVHIGWQPMYGNAALEKQFNSLLKPDQWERLITRLGEIENPTVRPSTPKAARKGAGDGGRKQASKKRASKAHTGE